MPLRRLVRGALPATISLAALAGPASPTAMAAGAPSAPLMADHVPRQVVVRFDPGVSARARAAARDAVGATLGRRLALPDAQLLVLPQGTGVDDAVRTLEGSPGVRYAEPNHFGAAQACPVAPTSGLCLPDDPRFRTQWTLDNIGQRVDGKAGSSRDADVDAAEAWAIARGSQDVVVAVVDSGIADDHPDLRDRMWTNAGELGSDGGGADKRSNGVDDDGNGHVDDWRGWDVVGRSVLDPDDSDNDPRDISGHGTHVAGILGAAGHNGKGVAGLNWDVRIMNVRVRAERSNETSADIADAFVYAARNGARIVNASLAERERSQYLADAIEAHPDVLFVVAAGNHGEDLGRPGNESYPCEYPAANLVCVAATGRRDELASWSNRDPEVVDLAAPGMITLSTVPAYDHVHQDTFESDPFGRPPRWVIGAAPESSSAWGPTGEEAWRSSTSMGSHATSDAHRPGAVTWVQTATPLDLGDRMGCDVETMVLSRADPGSGLFVQARRDEHFLAPSRTPAADSPRPFGDTVGFYAGPIRWRRRTTNISDLDGGPAYLRYGLMATDDPSAEPPRVFLDDVRVRCVSSRYSATATEEVDFMAGTSMATPHVAGAAALVLSLWPGTTAAELKADLLRSVDPLRNLAGKVATGGRLNVYKALARSTVAVEDGILAVRAGDGQRNGITVARTTVRGVLSYRVRDPWAARGRSPMHGSYLDAGAGCTDVTDTEVTCPAEGVTGVEVDAGDLDDRIAVSGLRVPATLRGGPGDDRLTGGAAADALIAGAGDDLLDARDRVADRLVECGEEDPPARDLDRVVADRIDPVLPSADGCERVSRR